MRNITIIGIVLAVLVCLCCAFGVGLFILGYNVYSQTSEVTVEPDLSWLATPSVDESTPIPTRTPKAFTVQPTVEGSPIKVDNTALETLNLLQTSLVPENDPRDLALRLKGLNNLPQTAPDPNAPYAVNAKKEFWVLDNDTNENYKVQTTLRYVTDHLYIWIENGVNYNDRAMRKLADAFENKMYPTNREFFGSEWSPGIDGDPHLYLVYVKTLGSHIAGYFSSSDEQLLEVHPYSNQHEGFMVASSQDPADTYTYGVLAHEFQHMIHWYQDRNEESWINEGFSELAVFLNGYGAGDKAFLYAMEPDTMLTDWPTDDSIRDVHYGVSFMFVKYFLDRFGDQVTQALVGDKQNGLAGVDQVLSEKQVKDAQSGKLIQADDVIADWAAANYLQDPNVADGRYAYKNYPDIRRFNDTDTVDSCPMDWQSADVNQYGVDYIRIACQGKVTLEFQGEQSVGVLPVDPHSGGLAFWSNKGDESDMTLTRTFDFSTVSGPLTFSYWTWYDLEEDYDYLFLEASTDGTQWTILDTPSCTKENPSGNSYGCGYNATTSNWIKETVDLSAYAGKKVQLRFEYVTDAAVNGEGFMLDDLALPEINYQTDFEKDDGGWEAKGFVRVHNLLPQTFLVSLIHEGKQVRVERITLDPNQTASIDLDLSDDVVLVVSGSTRFTRQLAVYRYRVTQ